MAAHTRSVCLAPLSQKRRVRHRMKCVLHRIWAGRCCHACMHELSCIASYIVVVQSTSHAMIGHNALTFPLHSCTAFTPFALISSVQKHVLSTYVCNACLTYCFTRSSSHSPPQLLVGLCIHLSSLHDVAEGVAQQQYFMHRLSGLSMHYKRVMCF